MLFSSRKSISYRKLYRFGQQYDIFRIPVNTDVLFRIYRYFLLFYTIYKVIFLITQYITLATFYIFYGVINFYHNSLYDKLWGMKKIVSVCGFTFSSLTTPHMTNYDKNFLKCCNINIVLNINLLQYHYNMAIHVYYVISFGLKGQSWKEVMESSSFIQKWKAFHISNAWQLVSVYWVTWRA